MQLAPHPVTLRQLQYIVAVADRQSFGKAAEACHVAQPSLSAQVAQVEESLGVQIFERTKRGVTLTAAGQVLVERARALLQAADLLERAVAESPVVVVGMAQNPFVKRARKALEEAGIEFKYLEYGSYFSQWKERLAIKLWSGWPTFPQVFVRGVLLGGADLTQAAIADGSLRRMMTSSSE